MIYRGGLGQWSWILHRVTGIGVYLFLLIHIFDTALILLGPGPYNHAMNLYKQPFFRPMEVLLFAAVLYHALNGIRVIIVDFWSQGPRYHKQIFHFMMIIFTVLFLVGSYFMVRSLFE